MDDAGGQSGAFLTAVERGRLRLLLDSVSSRTLLNVLIDMDRDNLDGRMIVEVIIERIEGRSTAPD